VAAASGKGEGPCTLVGPCYTLVSSIPGHRVNYIKTGFYAAAKISTVILPQPSWNYSSCLYIGGQYYVRSDNVREQSFMRDDRSVVDGRWTCRKVGDLDEFTKCRDVFQTLCGA